jgi:intracellular sulfur oxidation DsrE/DsrF family protein
MKVHVIAPLLLALAGAASTTALAQDKLNVVYHVSEAERVAFVLNNIQNHIDGVGGPDKVHIVLVAHGPAINAFSDVAATEKGRGGLAKLKEEGVELARCGNTLKGFNLTLDELLPGWVEVPQGGVTKIAELQSQGYAYIRP